MQTSINGAPAFAHILVTLGKGESITAESGAMQSMSAELDMKAHLNGNFFSALAKRFFAQESFWVSTFTNNTEETANLVITQDVPGEIKEIKLEEDRSVNLQRGAWLASAGNIKLKTKWSGFVSWFSGEGLFKLKASGREKGGKVWYGAYGGLIEKEIDGEMYIDNGFLAAWEDGIKLKITLPGGFFSSMFGGEGFVIKASGKGKVWIQTRSIKGLANWLNPKFS